jgi:hypothetical protein
VSVGANVELKEVETDSVTPIDEQMKTVIFNVKDLIGEVVAPDFATGIFYQPAERRAVLLVVFVGFEFISIIAA